jgi:FMN phosphatase YigB (HAD superfamily)
LIRIETGYIYQFFRGNAPDKKSPGLLRGEWRVMQVSGAYGLAARSLLGHEAFVNRLSPLYLLSSRCQKYFWYKIFENPCNLWAIKLLKGARMAITGNDMMAKTLKAVLFDYGGVLATEGFREGLREIAYRQGLDPHHVHLIGMDAIYESGYISGMGSEAEFWDLMRKRTGLTGTDKELAGEILSHFVIRQRMLEEVRRLREMGIIAAILSDQTDWLEQLDDRDLFYSEFDHVFNSYRLGKGKRDPSLFAGIGILPHEALFVDDLPANVERARAEGLQGIVFTDEAGFLAELERLVGS